MDKQYKILLSGGGTGGHIFPALAIANELKKRFPNSDIRFVGAVGKMEMEKVPKAGYPIDGLPIVGIQRSLSIKNLSFPYKLIKSLSKAKKIIKDFQPDIVIGTGGFASGPTLLAAQQLKIPTVIQEQNSLPGITNKWLGKKAKRIFTAYDNMHQFFPKERIVKTGNPVRAELFSNLPTKEEARAFFNLDVNKPVVFSVGGSLGSRTLNNVWKQSYKELSQSAQLLWQTGKLEYKTISEDILNHNGISVKEFIFKMNMAYAAADIIVSRAGAIAISELLMVGKPMILVPYPHAAEDHQTKNAQALVSSGAAKIIIDSQAENKLYKAVISLLENEKERENLAQNTKKLAQPDATSTIVNEILNLIQV